MAAEAKTKATTVSLNEFLETVADVSRRDECRTVATMMQKATGEKPVMWGANIVGFGRYKQVYANGKEGEWPLIAFSPRKTDLTLYIEPAFDTRDALLAKLGKHKTGKVCLYIRRLADVDINVLRTIIEESVKASEPTRVRG